MGENPTADDFPLLTYLDGLVNNLRELAPKAIRGEDVDAVHDARVATRRLKAAADLLDPVLSKGPRKKFSRITRQLRRRLGPMRDLDVMLEHLAEMKQPKLSQAVDWLESRLQGERESTAKESAGKFAPSKVLARLGAWWGLRQEIHDAKDAVDHLLAESVHLQLDSFAELANGMFRPPLAKAPSESPAEHHDPHELRIAGKSLRYTLEMAGEHGRPLPKNVLKLFKKMQELLGIWHDFVVLTERMLFDAADAELPLHEPDLQWEVLGLAQITLKKAQHELTRFGAMWTEEGSELSRLIRESFPLTRPILTNPSDHKHIAPGMPGETVQPEPLQSQPITESKTDPDPSYSPELPDPAASLQSP